MTTQTEISNELREMIIDAVETADLCCPEQVADMMIEAAESCDPASAGWSMALEVLQRASEADASERKSLGIA